MLVVLDTNILVSSLWSPKGAPNKVLNLMLNEFIVPCYDHRVMTEYKQVLMRDKFKFNKGDVEILLHFISSIGISCVPSPIQETFIDDSDKKFWEVALHNDAYLITGNLKHFPVHQQIVSVHEFLDLYSQD